MRLKLWPNLGDSRSQQNWTFQQYRPETLAHVFRLRSDIAHNLHTHIACAKWESYMHAPARRQQRCRRRLRIRLPGPGDVCNMITRSRVCLRWADGIFLLFLLVRHAEDEQNRPNFKCEPSPPRAYTSQFLAIHAENAVFEMFPLNCVPLKRSHTAHTDVCDALLALALGVLVWVLFFFCYCRYRDFTISRRDLQHVSVCVCVCAFVLVYGKTAVWILFISLYEDESISPVI